MHPQGEVMMVQTVGFLSSMWETWIEFSSPVFYPRAAPVIVGICEMNQHMGAPYLSASQNVRKEKSSHLLVHSPEWFRSQSQEPNPSILMMDVIS